MLIGAIYAKKCNPFKTFGRDYTAFKKNAQELRAGKCPNLINVPQAVRSHVEKLLTASPERRPDLVQLSKVLLSYSTLDVYDLQRVFNFRFPISTTLG